ncbi:putative Mitochondrial escape protein 2 [Glarea lozoyensis 74030]|uniref:Mitochondrial escape protein 2 n=1 Tax=Glarea lozoyensis (strain ATCC 74030 / MF5533) TaxID=1104152 RepID=H0ENR8_GLAL7|nr:putative Mitochondrial escape protein 2 [Glarea lozoyensis 74030]
MSPGKEAAELSQETLYSIFRKYGKLAEITSQPSDSKIMPKIRQCIMAKNCVHGLKVLEEAGGGASGTQLRLSYEQKVKAHVIRDWLVNHPRVVIPAVAALVATVTVAVFDPIRTFFIKAKIDHAFHIKDNRLYKWFKSQANDIFTFRHRREEDVSLGAIWADRREIIDQIQTWLMETADTFIVVQGPRGSGKKELIMDQALKDRRNTLVIDCKPIQEARGDSATISAAANAVGYRPVFSWMNSISSLVDLAAQGTIGVKSGFSETLDAQLGKIWQNTATALKQVALDHRDNEDKDANLNDDDWLEAHPEFRPVVVIDNFLHKNEDSSIVYDKISEWAALLTTANIAHVIFLTNDISYSKSLSKALPDRVFRQISLGDITPEVAKKFVITHLEPESPSSSSSSSSSTEGTLTTSQRREDLAELDGCIDVLGGRLTDLEFLARRLKTGQTPNRAVTEIIEQSASEILKMYLLTVDKAPRKWSPEQAWFLVKALAANSELRYNEVLLSNTFASSLAPDASNGEAVLEALSAAELITIKTYKGRPQSIKAGRPVYAAAFRLLTEDKVLRARMDLAILTELTKIETKSIDKYETELAMLGGLPSQPREVGPRVQFLLGKLGASQRKVEGIQ